eukprot:714453-Pelagomonas_calceolata.AAC.3
MKDRKGRRGLNSWKWEALLKPPPRRSSSRRQSHSKLLIKQQRTDGVQMQLQCGSSVCSWTSSV